MTTINNIDGVTFEIDGIEYQKNFISLVAGNNLRIVDVYDVRLELSGFDNYSNYTVNGNTYTNVADLQRALLPVLFTRASLNGIVVDGNIINVELVNDTLTFTLSDGTIVNINLPYVRSVTGTAVNVTDPRNVIIDKQPNVTSLFALDLSSATLSENFIDIAVTAINTQSPFNVNFGEQAVFFFDFNDGTIVRRYYFRETTGISEITTVSDNTLIADGQTTFTISDYSIDFGDIGSQNIENAFNTSPNEPFTISGQTFITAVQESTQKVWYWNGGDGEFGNSGSDGQAQSNDFIFIQSVPPISGDFLIPSNNLSDVQSAEQSRNNLDVYGTDETLTTEEILALIGGGGGDPLRTGDTIVFDQREMFYNSSDPSSSGTITLDFTDEVIGSTAVFYNDGTQIETITSTKPVQFNNFQNIGQPTRAFFLNAPTEVLVNYFKGVANEPVLPQLSTPTLELQPTNLQLNYQISNQDINAVNGVMEVSTDDINYFPVLNSDYDGNVSTVSGVITEIDGTPITPTGTYYVRLKNTANGFTDSAYSVAFLDFDVQNKAASFNGTSSRIISDLYIPEIMGRSGASDNPLTFVIRLKITDQTFTQAVFCNQILGGVHRV